MSDSQSMCVMIDARYLQPQNSGIGRYTEHLIHNLLALDAKLRLRLITLPEYESPFDPERVDVQHFDAPPNSLRTRFKLKSAIDWKGVQLFHSPFNILPADLPVQSVFTLHDIMWLIDANYCTESVWRKAITGTFYKKYIPASVEQATRILTVSHNSKTEIEDYFPSRKGDVDVTYNGVDEYFKPVEHDEAWKLLKPVLGSEKPFVLVVGQGSPYKNHYGALNGFHKAFGETEYVKFVIVRRFKRGPLHGYDKLAADPNVAKNIIKLEHVDIGVLRALYSAARVFLFPSLYEGFGLPALEAMACGTPVITSDRGAPAEISGDGGLKVDPNDHDAIADALRILFDDDERYNAVRNAGLERAGEFTWRRSAEQALATYRAVIRG